METGYKHFSHLHHLMMHEMSEGVEIPCSGCNASATGLVYVCWQCNFFLHEQCFRATRSLNHPSHPLHSLTLLPFPTYPYNSFFCNACKVVGTGFSYSCSECEFDLHVQCAYSISVASSFLLSFGSFSLPVEAHTHQPPASYYYNSNQEVVSTSWNGSVPVPPSAPYSFLAQNGHSVSVPANLNPIASDQNPHVHQNGTFLSIPPSASDLYVPQNGTSVSIPNPITVGQNSYVPQNGTSDSIPPSVKYPIISDQNSYVHQNVTSDSIPPSAQNPIISDQNPYVPQNSTHFSVPNGAQNPITSAQRPTGQNVHVSVPTVAQDPINRPQNSYTAQDIDPVSVPISTPSTPPTKSDQNTFENQGLVHFSHPHSLRAINLQDDEKEVACSACEETLTGSGYSCVETKCEFNLHESCFHLIKQIRHNSHPAHPLTLLSSAPYDNENHEFTCNACFSDGTGFTYNCSVCSFDLHIQCVNLPKTVKRDDHKHELKLHYSCPVKSDEYTFSCNVCHGVVHKDRWTYYCKACDYGTHLGCVDCEECDEKTSTDGVFDIQMDMQRLQIQMEMARQNAQFMSSLGASIASLAP